MTGLPAIFLNSLTVLPYSLFHSHIHPLFRLLIHSLTILFKPNGRVTGRPAFLPPKLTYSFSHSLTISPTHSLSYSHTHSLTHSLTLILSHYLTLTPAISTTHSLTYSLYHSHTLPHLLIRSHSHPHFLTIWFKPNVRVMGSRNHVLRCAPRSSFRLVLFSLSAVSAATACSRLTLHAARPEPCLSAMLPSQVPSVASSNIKITASLCCLLIRWTPLQWNLGREFCQ